MTVAQLDHDTPEQDRARVTATLAQGFKLRVVALLACIPLGHRDRNLLRPLVAVDADRISAEHIHQAATLAWRWRRSLPRNLAPKLNPDDPIVKALHHG